MELSKIIKDIKENFNVERNNGTIYNVIYLGVGTAAGYKEPDGSLADKNYHQYPPFLQCLKNSIPNLHISIILIDPFQEYPPYMVKDKGLVNKEFVNIELISNIYTSQDQSLTLYTWREDVYTEPYEDKRGIDITAQLCELNHFAMTSGCLFMYHDFTGKNNQILSEFFDEELKDHLSHIIYGLGLREDFGCYFDLSNLCSYHPFYIDSNNHIKLFNVYDYIVNDKLNLLPNDINVKYNSNNNHNIFNSHMERMLYIIKHELNNVMLQALRTVFNLITEKEVQNDDIKMLIRTSFAPSKRNICINLINDENYTGLYDILLTDFGKKLNIVSQFKGFDITGREMIEFITLGDDPFEWYNNVKHFL